MKKIALNKGMFALVDNEDFEVLSKYKWSYSGGYAKRWANLTTVCMHNFIMDTPYGMVVDHIDHNRLNNQKKNLRVCTPQENHENAKSSIKNASGYQGVYKSSSGWKAIVMDKGLRYQVHCRTLEEAISERKRMMKKIHPEFNK